MFIGHYALALAALATFGIIFGWLFVGWAAWADRHREAVYSS
jgi:hypothetical protein